MAEFLIDHFTERGERHRVAGRCTKGPIGAGHVFDRVYVYEERKLGSGYLPSVRVAERAVTIRVEKMMAYRHDMEQIDEALTAELTLSGKDAAFLKEEETLGNS